MSSQFNLFTWIREGVKQSVLMGVADAIDDIGTPPDNQHAAEQVRKYLHGSTSSSAALPAPDGGARSRSNKRLGRSLKDVAAPQ